MSVTAADLKAWLSTLPADAEVGIDEDGMQLTDLTGAHSLTIGGIPEVNDNADGDPEGEQVKIRIFNHAVSVAFEIRTPCKRLEDVPVSELIAAMRQRADTLERESRNPAAMAHEAFDSFDRHEEEEEEAEVSQ